MGVSEGELYGFARLKVEEGKLKIYTQWSLEPNPDWSRGEDLVFTSPEDAEKITETFKDVCVENVEVGEDGSITLWLKSKI
jgi:hypothetical protein